MKPDVFTRSLSEFSPAVSWINSFAPNIVKSALVERRRLRIASLFSFDPERREAGKTYSPLRRTLAEALICTTLNNIVDTLGTPDGFKQVTGTVYVPNIGENNRIPRNHTWLEREKPDGSIDILDLFAAQLVESTTRRFARGERTKELMHLVQDAEGVGLETISYKGAMLPILYGNSTTIRKTLSIVYHNPQHLPPDNGIRSMVDDLLRE